MFQNPPAHFWPGYFWILNNKLTEDKMLAQIRAMHKQGARSLCIHPMPVEFHPDLMGPQMDPPYLSNKFFHFIKAAVAECERLGMHYWLYDEGGWPSGSAAGRVYRKNPERFAYRRLISETFRPGPNRDYTVPANVFCAVTGKGKNRQVFKPGQRIPLSKQPSSIQLFRIDMPYKAADRGAPYVDVLCREAIETFLKLTHDRYAATVGNAFGKTIRFTFTDEPNASRTNPPESITWTDDLSRVFRARKGYDLLPRLPDLFLPQKAGESPDITCVRLDFYDVWSALFVERYLNPIQEWCRAHGLLSSGHFLGEDEPKSNAICGHGHILRAMRGLDLPGVDTIWRHIFPGKDACPFPLYAASIAAQKGQPYVLSESFAVYGAGLTPGQMKWVSDFQYVRGANLTVISNYPYSTRDHFLSFCRPQFGPMNPIWKYLDLYHRYTARMGYLLAGGQPACSTAFYFDIRGIWAGARDRERAVELHCRLSQALLSAQRAFHFIDDDVLAGRESRMEKKALVVGPMRYNTILVPACRWMEPEALRGLARFLRRGGTVIAVDGIPAADGGGTSLLDIIGDKKGQPRPELHVGKGLFINTSVKKAAKLLPPLVKLTPPAVDIRVCKRVWSGGAGYFFVNEADHELCVQAHFPDKGAAAVADPEDGTLRPLALTSLKKGVFADIRLAPWGSCFVIFGVAPNTPAHLFLPAETVSLDSGWRLRPIRAYRAGEHDYEIQDLPDANYAAAGLGDWRKLLGAHFSGDAEYCLAFRCAPEHAGRPARLDLGDVRYACEVILNGQSVGRRAWRPFVIDLGKRLRCGENELRIVVTNTFANAVLDPAVRSRWKAKLGKEWPVKELCYDEKSVNFEKESLASGLFGPVRLMISKR